MVFLQFGMLNSTCIKGASEPFLKFSFNIHLEDCFILIGDKDQNVMESHGVGVRSICHLAAFFSRIVLH